jgi:lipoprotein-anchoring transpeptidase ErfK/SrfK
MKLSDNTRSNRRPISANLARSLAILMLSTTTALSALAAEPWAVQHPGVPDPSKSKAPASASAAAPATAPATASVGTGAKPAPAAPAESAKSSMTLGKTIPVNGFHRGAPTLVLVDMSSHTTFVLQEQSKGKITKVFSASDSVGSDKTPTPPGPYWVSVKLKYPCWLPPKDIDPKQKMIKPYNVDRKNPLGVARIGLNKWGINLHGTNQPGSIRKSVSHGCIRHSNHDIMQIYNMVEIGTPVIIADKFAGEELSETSFEKQGQHQKSHAKKAGHKSHAKKH